MHKFPSIDQYRNAIRRVKDINQYAGKDEDGNPIFDYDALLPTLPFRGFVKIHGTNAGIVKDLVSGETVFQSRERIISPEDDNAGFAAYMSDKQHVIDSIVKQIYDVVPINSMDIKPTKAAIFGEWCGRGIMKGVGVNQLNKMFVIFAIKLIFNEPVSFNFGRYRTVENSDHLWMDVRAFNIHYIEERIFNVSTFGSYFVDIDFAKPEVAQNQMIEMTQWVEDKCPVAAYFGVDGVGEGIVWHCADDAYGSDVWFKVKGEKHSNSKVKTLAQVDVEAIEKLKDFVDSVVTENRLEWALNNLLNEQKKPLEMSSMGDFIRTVYNDVIKEEIDTIEASGFDQKKLGSPISSNARKWFKKQLTFS